MTKWWKAGWFSVGRSRANANMTGVRLDPDLLKRLDVYQATTGCSRSQAIRLLLWTALNAQYWSDGVRVSVDDLHGAMLREGLWEGLHIFRDIVEQEIGEHRRSPDAAVARLREAVFSKLQSVGVE